MSSSKVSWGPPTKSPFGNSNKQQKQQQQQQQQQPPQQQQQQPQVPQPFNQGPDAAMGGPGAIPQPFMNANNPQMQQEQAVAAYIRNFYSAMVQNRTKDVRYFYYRGWTELTDQFFRSSEWPSAADVAPYCDDNEVFLLCYTELSFRHVFVNGAGQLHHRFESWSNYRALFDLFLDGSSTSSLALPLEWLNDMLDEFLYQFQDFLRYRGRIEGKEPAELEILEQNPNVWRVQTVLGYLTSFVERSGITRELAAERAGGPALESSSMSLLQVLGYFSIIGLSRVQCILSDYYAAIKVLDPIDTDDRRALFTQITSCSITLFYYLGFSYMMMRRYADAINTFSQVLLGHRSGKDRTTSFADDQIKSKHDKIVALTAMAVALSPGVRVDEQVRRKIAEKYGDKLVHNNARLTEETVRVYSELFSYAAPKFVTPAAPDYSEGKDTHRVAEELQLKWFVHEVEQQLSLPTIRSYLRLYKTIPLQKLAKMVETPDTNEFREMLMSIKHRSNQLMHTTDGSAPIDGTRVVVNDVQFVVVGDMVHIEDVDPPKPAARHFLSNAMKFAQICEDMNTEGKHGKHQQYRHPQQQQQQQPHQ